VKSYYFNQNVNAYIPGVAVFTIEDVAKLAGVSTATVSRVVNNNGNVTTKTGQRVLVAMKELDYHPNKFARGLAGNQADGIGVVIQNFADPFFGMVLRGIESVTKKHNLQITVASANRSSQDELKAIEFLRKQHYNVVILTTTTLAEKTLLELSKEGTEFVHIGYNFPAFAERCIYLDDAQGAELATGHLIAQGHKRIACLAFPKSLARFDMRWQGYRRALEKAGLPYNENLVIQPADFDQTSALRATQELLERKESFTAIFASTDMMAVGAYKALQQGGLKIPEDISVVGYDDIDLASFLSPPLTTIKQPIQEMSMAAAQLAIYYLKDQVDTKEVVHQFTPSLVVRDSVKTIGKKKKSVS
jgi:LacI family transcriptional regulator